MPNLVSVQLLYGLWYVEDITITGSSYSIPLSCIDVGTLEQYVNNWECWSATPVPYSITELVIGNWKCNDARITELDLSRYPMLKSVTIGSDSFMYVKEVKMIGMNELENVVIEMNSFTRCKNDFCGNNERRFYLKDCQKLKSLRVRDYAFSDYSTFVLESVDALEEMEMGVRVFNYASFVLKSMIVGNE